MRCSRFGGNWENFRTRENQEKMYKRQGQHEGRKLEGNLLELRKTRRENIRSENKRDEMDENHVSGGVFEVKLGNLSALRKRQVADPQSLGLQHRDCLYHATSVFPTKSIFHPFQQTFKLATQSLLQQEKIFNFHIPGIKIFSARPSHRLRGGCRQ